MIFSLEFQKIFSITRTFFSHISQNNFGNKIPIFQLQQAKNRKTSILFKHQIKFIFMLIPLCITPQTVSYYLFSKYNLLSAYLLLLGDFRCIYILSDLQNLGLQSRFFFPAKLKNAFAAAASAAVPTSSLCYKQHTWTICYSF